MASDSLRSSRASGSRSSEAADAARPLYQQIKDRITRRITSGEWAPGRKIPSENEIVKELGVSRMTVHRALREMAHEGFLTRIAGVGSFVAEAPRQASLIEIRDIAEEVRAAGSRHSARVLQQKRLAASPEIAERLEVAVGFEVCAVRLVHSRDDLPIQHEERSIHPDFLPDFDTLDFASATPSEVLLDRVAPTEVEHVVQAITASAELRRELAMPADEPCLQLRRRTWNGSRVVTCAVLTYPASRYQLGARYSARSAPSGFPASSSPQDP